MKNVVLACILVLNAWSCSGESLSLDCIDDSEHVKCDESIGAICDSSVHRCLCNDKSENCPCTAHSLCQSQVCDFSRSSPQSEGSVLTGRCVPSASVVYFNPQFTDTMCSQKGSRDCPFTKFNNAFDLARDGANNRPFIQMTGELKELVNLSIDENNKPSFPISIVGTYDLNTIVSFLPETSRPALSVFSNGIKIIQGSKNIDFKLSFDSVEIDDGIWLEGVDDTMITASVSISRSKLVKYSDKLDIYPVRTKDFVVDIDKSIIKTALGPALFSSKTTTSFSTAISNTVIFLSEASPLLLKGTLPKDNVRLLYNSVVSPALSVGFCGNDDSSRAHGNLFWAPPIDCTSPSFLADNVILELPESTTAQEYSVPFSCVHPYRLSEGSKRRIKRPVSTNTVTQTASWDFCGLSRNSTSHEVSVGALCDP